MEILHKASRGPWCATGAATIDTSGIGATDEERARIASSCYPAAITRKELDIGARRHVDIPDVRLRIGPGYKRLSAGDNGIKRSHRLQRASGSRSP